LKHSASLSFHGNANSSQFVPRKGCSAAID
jgi:hypothetical protein